MSRFLALIPVRGRDGEEPGLALAELGGRRVLDHTLAAAREAPAVDRVVVATAHGGVAAHAACHGVPVVRLPDALTAAAVPAEAVMLHVLDELASAGEPPDYLVLLAPQAPLRRPGRVEAACAAIRAAGADSLLSVCPEPLLVWRASPGGLVPFYDPADRPPRHGGGPDWLRENGSIYISACAGFRRARNRLFGRLETLAMDRAESVRVDDPEGLAVCRALLSRVRPEAPADVPGDCARLAPPCPAR